MDTFFGDILKILYKTKVEAFGESLRKDRTAFNKKLSSCKLQESHVLPWGRSRSVTFQNYLRRFFAPCPLTRPLAETLARDKALPL